ALLERDLPGRVRDSRHRRRLVHAGAFEMEVVKVRLVADLDRVRARLQLRNLLPALGERDREPRPICGGQRRRRCGRDRNGKNGNENGECNQLHVTLRRWRFLPRNKVASTPWISRGLCPPSPSSSRRVDISPI